MNDRKMGNIGTTSGSNPVIVHGIFNIIPSEDNQEETWYTPRLTEEEWKEIYGGK